MCLCFQYKPLPSIPVPPAAPKEAYGSVKMNIVSLSCNLVYFKTFFESFWLLYNKKLLYYI